MQVLLNQPVFIIRKNFSIYEKSRTTVYKLWWLSWVHWCLNIFIITWFVKQCLGEKSCEELKSYDILGLDTISEFYFLDYQNLCVKLPEMLHTGKNRTQHS